MAAVAAALKAKVEVAAAVGNDASAAGEEQDSRLQEGAIVKIHSLQSAAAQQHNGAHAELGKFNPDTGRWQAKLLRGKTLSGIEIAVKPANLLFAEGGGKEEEERRQEALEKKEAETAPQVIQRRRLSQEKDDDAGLAGASSAKIKNKSKKKKPGQQGASASQKAPWATEAKEAGGSAAAGVGVEAEAWPPPLQVDVEKAPSIMSAAAVGEAIFMAKFNWSSSEGSSGAAPNLEEEKMRRRVLRANSPCTAAAEEEMREAGAREGCEATIGVGGVLARSNIAAVPKEDKGKTKMKGAHEASGAAGARQGEGGMCGDFADLALEPSLALEPLSAQMAASSAHVDSRECALANATHIDLPRFHASPGICII